MKTAAFGFVGILVLGALATSSAPAFADEVPKFGPHDVQSVMFIAKSENKNQVHYALSLDDQCHPSGTAPVKAYWRDYEKGDNVLNPLLDREQRAYGIASQKVEGDKVQVVLRALSSRPITFEAKKENGKCTARAYSTIDGQNARLANVYVKLGFPFRVEYLLLQGLTADGSKALSEKLKP